MFLSPAEEREQGNWEKEEGRKRERESPEGGKGEGIFSTGGSKSLNHREYTLGV